MAPMLRYRALVSLLLCLALPLQGLAAVMLPAPCPMAAMTEATATAAEPAAAHAHAGMAAKHGSALADCCNGAAGRDGKPCKMGNDCLAAPAMAPAPVGPVLDLVPAAAPVLALIGGPARLRLGSIWRPPSAFL